jgi:ribA/ribD-fused uncharacterized protein
VLLVHIKAVLLVHKKAYFNGDKLKVDGVLYGVDDIPNLPSHLNPEKACTKRSDDVVLFFGKHSPLSNFHECSLTLDGFKYTGVEQRYQQKKAEWAKNDNLAQQILSATYPARQKYLGDKAKMDDATWKTTGLIEMFNAVKAKFVQNEQLKEYLLATDRLPLGEHLLTVSGVLVLSFKIPNHLMLEHGLVTIILVRS